MECLEEPIIRIFHIRVLFEVEYIKCTTYNRIEMLKKLLLINSSKSKVFV